MLYLWDAKNPSGNIIHLEFFDSSNGEIKKFIVEDYRPYFLTRFPLTTEEHAAIDSVSGEVEVIMKQNLFSEETTKLAKISASTPPLLKKLLRQFNNVWEREIDYCRSYIYDMNLVFGAPHFRENNDFLVEENANKCLETEFEEAFQNERNTAPHKYFQIKEWFNLCQKPVPEIHPDLFNAKKSQEGTEERTYLAFLLSRIANIPVPESYNSRRVSDWIKSMIYTYMRRNNILIPTSAELRKGLETHAVSGALTIEPEAGIYFNTVVCDFESLYPSCIDSYNLSYETIDCLHEECKSNKVPETDHHVCAKRKGFYSLLIGALKDLRIRWFKPKSIDSAPTDKERLLARAASELLKLISVSSYGVTVRIHGVACPPLAESITGYGRWALQTSWDMSEKIGMHPIYGDTDSIFLDNPTPSQVQTLMATVKKRLKLDLAVDKHYTICVLPRAKKAYFGITRSGKPDLKGLTAVKSNAPKYIQKVFQNCVAVLSDIRNMEQYRSAQDKILVIVHEAITKLRKRQVNLGDLVYSVKLYHDPHERMATTNIMPQPYQCAFQLMEKGEELKRRDTVHFVKVNPFAYKGRTFTVKPVDSVKNLSEVNVDDYIRNLMTALEQTFEPMQLTLRKEAKLTDWF